MNGKRRLHLLLLPLAAVAGCSVSLVDFLVPPTVLAGSTFDVVGDANDDTFPDVGVASFGMGVAVFLNQMSAFSPYGEGCAGTLPSPPAIGSIGNPTLGNATFAWTVSTGIAGAPAFLVLGASKTYL